MIYITGNMPQSAATRYVEYTKTIISKRRPNAQSEHHAYSPRNRSSNQT